MGSLTMCVPRCAENAGRKENERKEELKVHLGVYHPVPGADDHHRLLLRFVGHPGPKDHRPGIPAGEGQGTDRPSLPLVQRSLLDRRTGGDLRGWTLVLRRQRWHVETPGSLGVGQGGNPTAGTARDQKHRIAERLYM